MSVVLLMVDEHFKLLLSNRTGESVFDGFFANNGIFLPICSPIYTNQLQQQRSLIFAIPLTFKTQIKEVCSARVSMCLVLVSYSLSYVCLNDDRFLSDECDCRNNPILTENSLNFVELRFGGQRK